MTLCQRASTSARARVLAQVRIVHDELPRRVGAHGLERPALCRVLQSALNFAGREVTMRLREGGPDQEAQAQTDRGRARSEHFRRAQRLKSEGEIEEVESWTHSE